MRVHHVALRTHDLGRLEAFYTELVGLAVRSRDGTRSVWLEAGGAVLMLEVAGDWEPEVPSGSMELLAFTIDAGTHAEHEARLARAGVPIEQRTEHTIYFRDPDGRRVALSDYPL